MHKYYFDISSKYHLIRATLESLAYQVVDVVDLMQRSTNIKVKKLKVDGGASANKLLLQFQADVLGVTIEKPICVETTALGAAYMCGLTLGVYSSLDEIKRGSKREILINPTKDEKWREEHIRKWRKAVERSLCWAE